MAHVLWVDCAGAERAVAADVAAACDAEAAAPATAAAPQDEQQPPAEPHAACSFRQVSTYTCTFNYTFERLH